MARPYEIVYIFDSALDESQVNEHLERFHQLLVLPNTAEHVKGVQHWGKRTLAYPIKGKETGYYVVAHVETQPESLGEFERAVKLNEAVLRHLIVLNEAVAVAATAGAGDAGDETAVAEEDDE